MRRISWGRWVAILLAAGCGGGDTGGPDGPDTTRNLAIQDGNNQTVAVGQPVGVPPSVRVTNSTGSGVSGVAITFAVASGGGTLTGGSQTTNAQGVATVGGWVVGTAPGANTLTASIQGTSSSVTFTATAAAGAPATLEKAAGDGQTAAVKTAVAVKPSVRVLDQHGNPVASATVVFSVTGGGGSVAGGTQQTNASGVATVGDWILGPTDGANALSATVQGTALTAAVFAAIGKEVVLQPSQDTTLAAGTINLTRLVIPAGRTVTLAGDVTINADSVVEIAGKIVGDCRGLTVVSEQTVTVTGSIDNSCAVPGDAPPGLLIVGREGYLVTGTDSLATSGDGRITNDPDLSDEDFPDAVSPAAVRSRPVALAQQQQQGCRVVGKAFVTKPVRAKIGANGKTGGNGADAKTWTLSCRGADLDLGAGVRVLGQDGGHGGVGADLNGDPGDARGGNGGKGGLIRVLAKTGRVIFSGAVQITSGDGGDGGDARATAVASKAGQKAAGAKATGGNGAEPGLVQVIGEQGIVGGQNLTIILGSGGRGGDAEADGANGVPGRAPAGSDREQDGGDAEAIGGVGAGSPANQFRITGNAGGMPTLQGGDGRRGGNATATAGNGSFAPTEEVPDGGHGGAIKATGGEGGHARATFPPPVGGLIGDGGDGGFARFLAGIGGDGWNDCGVEPKQGGAGGNGGDATGADGVGGTGFFAGDDGNVFVETAGNGGKGGNGQPVGAGGLAGADGITVNGNRTDVEPAFEPGVPGNPCAPAPKLFVSLTEILFNHIVGESPCPTLGPPLIYRNDGDEAIEVQSQVVGTSLYQVGSAGTGVLQPGQQRTVPHSFNCAQARSVAAELVISVKPVGSAAPPVVQRIPVTVNTQTRALKLNHAVGGFSAGTVIPLANITGAVRVAAHPPFCAYEHVHEAVPGSGIRIQGGAPVLDPEPTGCGFGEVVLMTLPPP